MKLTTAITLLLAAASLSAPAQSYSGQGRVTPESLRKIAAREAERQALERQIAITDSLAAAAAALEAERARQAALQPADTLAEPQPEPLSVSDSLMLAHQYDNFDPLYRQPAFPRVFFLPQVYDTYHYYKPLEIGENAHSGLTGMGWVDDADILMRQMLALRNDLFYNHPGLVKYNLEMLPVAPPVYTVVLDPSDFSISVRENVSGPGGPTLVAEEVKKRHWIRDFGASLQFSQAYVSPNWYQGGNNNLNVLGRINYHVKLNQAFHPNLMFETNLAYKVGANNAPDDSIHAYNITEDLLQFNTTFGIKATKNWYYSFTGQFKTQLLNSYKSNTNTLTSAFLSPAELTTGVGMTYTYANPKKTISFNASIAPVSYQLNICTSDRLNRAAYGIKDGHTSVSKFGSTVDLTLDWKVAYNITYKTRLFGFTDYESFQANWENTLAFAFNRYLTTQLYWHLRYDTLTKWQEDYGNWKKLQCKEIFSIGFTYAFATI